MVLFLAGVQAVQLGLLLLYYITPSHFSNNLPTQLSLSLSNSLPHSFTFSQTAVITPTSNIHLLQELLLSIISGGLCVNNLFFFVHRVW